MQKTLVNYSITLLFILLSSILFSLIIALFYTLNVITPNSYSIVTNIISSLIFLSGGLILGIRAKEKGLIKGIVFSLFLTILIILINLTIIKDTFSLEYVLNIVIRFIILPIGSIIGVNLK